MLNTFYRRIARPTCIMAALLSPVLLIGAKGAFESNRNDVLDWLPSSFEETRRLRWFVERFGSDEILVLSWPGCTLEDPRLDALSQHLVRPLPSVDRTRDVVWFRQVITGRQIRAEFTTEPLSLTSAQAVDRMKGWLLGPDGETTCAVALVSVEGSLDRESAVQAACDAASGCGIDPDYRCLADSRLDRPERSARSGRSQLLQDYDWLGAARCARAIGNRVGVRPSGGGRRAGHAQTG